MNLKIITDVVTEPLTLTEVKSHIRVEATDENSYINSLITVAREFCETVTRRALATQTLELILDNFPRGNYLELPKSPVQSVESIKYKDSSGIETSWDSNYYIADIDKVPAIITPAYGVNYPSFVPYPTGAVRIRYIAGYTTDIPQSIKQAMLLLIGHLHEHREETTEKALSIMPIGIKALLTPYKLWGW